MGIFEKHVTRSMGRRGVQEGDTYSAVRGEMMAQNKDAHRAMPRINADRHQCFGLVIPPKTGSGQIHHDLVIAL